MSRHFYIKPSFNFIKRSFLLSAIVLFVWQLMSCKATPPTQRYVDNAVWVGIEPIAAWVKKIAGDDFTVHVLLKSGYNPVTYQIGLKQFNSLQNAKIFYHIGLHFEKTLVSQIKEQFPNLSTIDLQKGVTLLPSTDGHHHDDDDDEHATTEQKEKEKEKENQMYDPHIWLSPTIVAGLLPKITESLIALAPNKKAIYLERQQKFLDEIATLTNDIHALLKPIPQSKRAFMIYHPSLGYFANEFNLKQYPLEVEGKKPSTKKLNQTIGFMREKNIKVMYVQPQFHTRVVYDLAQITGAKVYSIDILSGDWQANLKKIATTLTTTHDKNP